MRHLHLIFRARPDHDHEGHPALPTLDKLLRRGRPLPTPACLSEACCQALGIARQEDWPIAPFTARAAGLDVGQDYWLRLDPVHLDVGMQGLFLRAGLALDETEVDTLCALVSPLLAPHGLEALPGPGGVLHVRCPSKARLATTPLDQVDGRQPTRFLPSGEDAPLWSRLLHEVQMVLHEHPFNLARLSAGTPPVNSLWPWGGGHFVPPNAGLDGVWTDLDLPRQLAKALGLPTQPCPAGLDQVLAIRGSRGLVVVDTAEQDECTLLPAWERDWFRPLFTRLRLGRLGSTCLTLPGAEARFLSPLDAWRLWL